jgi:LAO/AO transport system kinase
MFVAFIFVFKKNDLSGADALVSTLRSAIGLASGQVEYGGHHQSEPPIHSDVPETGPPGETWQIPVTDATALHHEGIDQLVEIVDAHRDYLQGSGLWRRRERERVEADLKALIKQIVVQRLMAKLSTGQWDAVVEDVLNRKLNPQMAADKLWNSIS